MQLGRTALYFASWKCHVEIVKKLLKRRADVSICDVVCTFKGVYYMCAACIIPFRNQPACGIQKHRMCQVVPPFYTATQDVMRTMKYWKVNCIVNSFYRMVAVHCMWQVKKAILRL